TYHQSISLNLVFRLMTILRSKQTGRLFDAPLDVKLDEENIVQPDIIYVENEKQAIITPKCIEGIPDIIVEILSAGSVSYDRKEKMDLYHRFKVPEYWIVDPANQSIEIYEWKDTYYDLYTIAEQKGEMTSKLQPQFVINIEEIFAQL
ncbi:MAG TPA: Uma2 family endonuclease, partial [Bacteroidia bacterium]|nr:Uma2 family endonuclease [Bacteroidia bacterium]